MRDEPSKALSVEVSQPSSESKARRWWQFWKYDSSHHGNRADLEMNMADLRTLFRWDDPDRYEWVLSGSTRGFLSRVGPVIGVGLIIPVISYIATGLIMLIPVFMIRF